MISDAELESIREAQGLYMASRVIIKRPVPIAEGEISRKVIAEDVSARISSGPGSFGRVADRYQGITPYTVTVAVGTDVRVNDEIIDEAGNLYHVRDVETPKTYHTALQMLTDGVS